MKYYVIFIISFILLLPVSNVFADSDYILNMNTENSKYLPGQVPVIFGTIHDYQYNPITTKIVLSIIFDENNQNDEVYKTSVLVKNGQFRHVGFSPENTGTYTINAIISDQVEASTEIIIEKIYLTTFGYGALATIVFLFFLLIAIGVLPKRQPVTSSEPIRFALLTLCTLIPIITLIGTDVQIGQDGVAGLVIQEISEPVFSINLQNTTLSGISDETDVKHFNWVMHFGGNVHDNYQSGITVPIYILFFGMIGGYLRFLYKTQKGWFIERAVYEIKRIYPEKTDSQLRHDAGTAFDAAEKVEENTPLVKRVIFNNSMQDLSLIFLPPILAVASYFLLLQGGLDEKDALPTFAVVSFAIGLISNEIVQKLANFASTTVGNSNTVTPTTAQPITTPTDTPVLNGAPSDISPKK